MMPEEPDPLTADRERLAALPKRLDLEIEGAIRPLTTQVLDEGRFKQPAIAVWVEVGTGLIRDMCILVPENHADEGRAEALAGLVQGLARSKSSVVDGQERVSAPGLPRRVLLDDSKLADAVRSLLPEVEVELAERLPSLDATYVLLNAAMVGEHSPQPPDTFSWDVNPALLLPLYEATAAYFRHAPWQIMSDQPPIAIALGEVAPDPATTTRYGCVIGNDGTTQGLAVYYTVADLEHALDQDEAMFARDEDLDAIVAELGRIGIGIDGLPHDKLYKMARDVAIDRGIRPETVWTEEAVILYFSGLEESPPAYLAWLQQHALPIPAADAFPSFWRTGDSRDPRRLDDGEIYMLTAVLQALNGFLDRFRHKIAAQPVPLTPLSARIPVITPEGERWVEVRWPFL